MNRCDRCGFTSKADSLFTDLLVDYSVIVYPNDSPPVMFGEGSNLQLCPSCFQAFQSFMSSPSVVSISRPVPSRPSARMGGTGPGHGTQA